MAESIRRDPNTLSNYDCFRTTHTKVDLTVDFNKKTIAGSVRLILQALQDAQTAIILDTSHLEVHDVKVDERPCKWELLPRSEPFGSPLRISLQDAINIGKIVVVEVILNLLHFQVIPHLHIGTYHLAE